MTVAALIVGTVLAAGSLGLAGVVVHISRKSFILDLSLPCSFCGQLAALSRSTNASNRSTLLSALPQR